MDYKLFSFVLLSVVLAVSCKSLDNAENATTSLIGVAEGLFRTGRARTNLVYANLISCAIRYDTTCLVDAAGDYFEERKNELLAQADSAFVKSNGRADPETTPSHVAKSIEKLLSELSGLFKDSVLSFFSSRESEEDDEVVDSEGQDSETNRAVNGDKGKQLRGKKEGLIQKICNLIKKIILGVTLAVIVHYIFKFTLAGLKFLYWLVEVGHLILAAIRTYLKHKNAKQEDIIVHYEDANHSHHHPEVHYEDSGEHYEEPEHEYHESKPWDRNYYAQNLAYSKQKPQSFLGSLFT